MKVIKSSGISPFGGINFVLEELNTLGLGKLLQEGLPVLSKQSKYTWKDIFFTYWSVFFCGGDCAEDVSINLKPGISPNPFINLPSPDRLLERLKGLSEPVDKIRKNRAAVVNEFAYNMRLSDLNIKVLKTLDAFKDKETVLDYDNTFIYTQKADAKRTYTQGEGYCPGIGIIGRKIVYVENRNGNCSPRSFQEDTFERMFSLLESNNVKVNVFRADAASYQFAVLNTVNKYVDQFYIRAVVNHNVSEAIRKIDTWKLINIAGRSVLRGSTLFTPFTTSAENTKQKHLLKEYRLVVTKEARNDGQINAFTGEAFNYTPIITNDFTKTDDQVIIFYNQRGKQEREFDVLKNDFAWNKQPFSKLEQNTVFLIMTAMCRNIYEYIIQKFSKTCKFLHPYFRIKKFIFRFICIPAKWVKTSRSYKLRLYGNIWEDT